MSSLESDRNRALSSRININHQETVPLSTTEISDGGQKLNPPTPLIGLPQKQLHEIARTLEKIRYSSK